MVKRKLKLRKNVLSKIIIFLILVSIMILLFFASYYIYTNSRKDIVYKKNVYQYSYLVIDEMSDSFAIVDNKELHFVKSKNNIYIVAIDGRDKEKYTGIIDYTYGKTKDVKQTKIYGYPIKVNTKIQNLAVKYINDFLSYEDKIDIDINNYSKYFPDTYLDTTIHEFYKFNYIVFFLLLLVLFILILFVYHFFLKRRIKKLD